MGHLFENRYKSILCDKDTYLLALVRYIQLNPVRAKGVKAMKELDGYPWSGHWMIIAKDEYPWMDRAHILDQFAGMKRKAIREYRRFVQEGLREGRNPMLTGGGLTRSQGGLVPNPCSAKEGGKELSDERILGSGDFVDRLLQGAEVRQLRQMKLRRRGRGKEDII